MPGADYPGKKDSFWTSPRYSHCNFTALADLPVGRARHWMSSLLRMDYTNPRWRPLMDQEGLKSWIAADEAVLEAYRILFKAVEQEGLSGLPGQGE